MLEKPELPDEKLIACLQAAYALHSSQIAFLPLGADVNTAVYQVITSDTTPYFLKLRRGHFDAVTVAIPRCLSEQGIAQIIAPIATRGGRLWTRVDAYTMSVYPFVTGHNGFEVELADHQWIDLGIALKGIHSAPVPPALWQQLPREDYSPHWRNLVRSFQVQAEENAFAEPVAAELAVFMQSKRAVITDLVTRAEQLGNMLAQRSLETVLCHADIHAGNVLIEDSDTLYIVDWDTLIVAPKERDLMFVGAGIGNVWRSSREAELFYQGYGPTEIDPMALTYYRYERIVQDIAAYCEQLLLTDVGGEDRAVELRHFVNSFLPNSVVEIAYRTDKLLHAE